MQGTIMNYMVIASGAYLVGLAFLINGHNLKSDIILRVIPGLIGAGNLIAGLKMAGIL